MSADIKRKIILEIEVDVFDLEAESPRCRVSQITKTDNTFYHGSSKNKIGFEIDELEQIAKEMVTLLKIPKDKIKVDLV